MARNKGIFYVQADQITISKQTEKAKRKEITIEQALTIIYQQMKIAGNRERTINSYDYIFQEFIKFCELKYVEDIDSDTIYNYLNMLNVSNETKLIRLKSIKVVLGKFHNNGWIKEKFWTQIHIKIDRDVKKGAKPNDVDILLSLIDKNTFVGFRDTVAILTLYRTGIRIRTLGELTESHIDFADCKIKLDN